jgi:ribosomal protein S8
MHHIALLNAIKMGYAKGKVIICLKLVTGLQPIIKLLFKYKLIVGHYIKGDYIYILLKYDAQNRTIINNIQIVSRPGHRRFVTKFKLQTLQYTMDPTSFFLLRTKEGLKLINKKEVAPFGGEMLAILA